MHRMVTWWGINSTGQCIHIAICIASCAWVQLVTLAFPHCLDLETSQLISMLALCHYQTRSGLACKPQPFSPRVPASFLGSEGAALTSGLLGARCTPVLGGLWCWGLSYPTPCPTHSPPKPSNNLLGTKLDLKREGQCKEPNGAMPPN